MTATTLLTAEDLARIPENKFLELIRGELVEMAPDNVDHGQIGDNVQFPLSRWAREHRAGRVMSNAGFTFEMEPDTVLAPDISFLRADRVPPRGGPAYPAVVPDLAVEILSPSNTAAEIARKVAIYLAAGVRLVWIVDPASRSVVVHAPGEARLLGAGDTLDGGDVLPGFAVPVADLFA